MQRAALILLWVFSEAADAHPSGVAGFVHPFVGVDHLLAMLAVGLWAAQLGGRWTWIVPLAFVSAMAAGGAAGLAGATLPLVEPMVAASVLVLGVLVALRVERPLAGAVLVAAFAVFHGLAHGAELPAGTAPFGYAAGFVAATALLHAAGVGTGLWLRKERLRERLAGAPIALAGCWLLLGALS